jgi:hypothetical protein
MVGTHIRAYIIVKCCIEAAAICNSVECNVVWSPLHAELENFGPFPLILLMLEK